MNDGYSIRSSVADHAKDYNCDLSITASLTAKLNEFDVTSIFNNYKDILEALRKDMFDSIKNTFDTNQKREALNKNIDQELTNIKHELSEKMQAMSDDLRLHQNTQRSDSVRIQGDLNSLKKDKLDLMQKIQELTRRLNDLENDVGIDSGQL